MSIINNDADPLKAGPEAGRVLMERFARSADEFPPAAVIDAAANLLVNAIRQSFPSRGAALTFYDELFGRTKTLLESHYDSVTGRRRQVFAHTQHVIMDVHRDPEL